MTLLGFLLDHLVELLPRAAAPPAPRDLPVEVVNLIFTYLFKDMDAYVLNPSAVIADSAREHADAARRAGVACCLTSKAFLPLGRRLLYSHITDLDKERFLHHVTSPHTWPHLRPYVRSYTRTWELQLNVERDPPGIVELIAEVCPNLRNINHIGKPAPLQESGATVPSCLSELRFLASPSCNVIGRLDGLSLTCLRAGPPYDDLISSILLHHTSLKFLSLEYQIPPHDVLSTIPGLNLSNLRHLVLTVCPHDLADALFRGAPNLVDFESTTLSGFGTCKLPLLNDLPAHLNLQSLKLQVIEADRPTPIDPHEVMSDFVSHFPNLTRLALGWHHQLHLPNLVSPFPVSSFHSALPSSLIDLALTGDFYPAGLALANPLLTSPTFLPTLSYLEIYWLDPSGVSPEACDTVAHACAQRSITLGGAFWLIKHEAGIDVATLKHEETKKKLKAALMDLVDELAVPVVIGVAMRYFGAHMKMAWLGAVLFPALYPRRYLVWPSLTGFL
ncbi:hypothetical protein RQP46_006052 [Phenoliferia psychrophenolica]